MLRQTRRISLLSLMVALAGCERTPASTAPRLDGEVAVSVTDDSGSPVPPNLPSLPTGNVTVNATVTLVAETGGAEEIASETTAPTLEIGSTSLAPLGRGVVSPIRYTLVRIVFARAEANVTGGLLVGGTDVRGAVSVALPQAAVVERPIVLEVAEAGHHELTIDLNSETWLAAVDPVTRTVNQAALLSAITVEAR